MNKPNEAGATVSSTMQTYLLTNQQHLFLQKEKAVLREIEHELAGFNLSAESSASLRMAIQQLDELFLLVVAGEFNAGKSALINALLGAGVLREGVTPTTAKVTLVRWGEEIALLDVDEGFAIQTHPLPLLKELNIVDSPGTNALNRLHERLTDEFVPRCDMALFVTSADHPLTQSERLFLERILAWGKKVVLAVNKADILDTEASRAEVREFVITHAREILGTAPDVFLVSARAAARANALADPGAKQNLLEQSGLPELQRFITEKLDAPARFVLKLRNPLGVVSQITRQAQAANAAQASDLSEDAQLVESLENTLAGYQNKLETEQPLRLSEIDGIIRDYEMRGQEYFDRNLRLSNILKLAKTEQVKAQFHQEVVQDLSGQIDQKVRGLIDNLVDNDLNTWYQVGGAIERRQKESEKNQPEGLSAPQVQRRRELIESVSASIDGVISAYDTRKQAEELSALVQDSVAQTALFGVGALGVGAMVVTVLTTRALDVTGIVAAGTLAVIGLFVIPHKRRQAKASFKEKVTELRLRLGEILRLTLKHESQLSVQRMRDKINPYTSFVRNEIQKVDSDRQKLEDITAQVNDLISGIEKL